MLNQGQIDQYREQGYLVLKALVPADQLAALRASARTIVDEFDIERHRTVFSTGDRDAGRDDYFFASAEGVHCFLEEGAVSADGQLQRPRELAINKIGHAMHDLVPAFTAFCRQSVFVDILRAIGCRSPRLWQTMYIFKQPRIGGEVRWHQDATYLITEPPGVTGLWIAIEDAHLGNGCLWVAPGGHRGPLRDVYEASWEVSRDVAGDVAREAGGAARAATLRELDRTPWPQESAVALEVPAGSLVLLHDHLPHYSSRNHSDSSRQAFTMHCADADAVWSARNWLHRPRLGHFDL